MHVGLETPSPEGEVCLHLWNAALRSFKKRHAQMALSLPLSSEPWRVCLFLAFSKEENVHRHLSLVFPATAFTVRQTVSL